MSIQIALCGNPNSGKTTLFNKLTGNTARVGNWPGVTVDRREGTYSKGNWDMNIVDLPGVYSLSPYTPEEVVSREYIVSGEPDVILNVVDATNLVRNLYLTTQVLETEKPTVMALNMIDEVDKQGDSVNVEGLSKELGIPVVAISAAKGTGVDELMDTVAQIAGKRRMPKFVFDKENLPAHQNHDEAEAFAAHMRYQYIANHCEHFYKTHKSFDEESHSDKIDKILTHRYLGIPIFILIMYSMFHLTFSGNFLGTNIEAPGSALQSLVMGWWDSGLVPAVSRLLVSWNASGMIQGLMVDGILAGVGGVLSFIPQIMMLFLCLSVLEDSGYMARAAFVMDKPLRQFGLSGKSFVPMLMGFGCSVPAIMATRTLENEKDRRITMMLVPYMSCGAKMPIYGLFAAALFAKSNHADLIVFVMYILGIGVALIAGLILKNYVFKGEESPFIMELPHYRLPKLNNLILHLWEKLKDYMIRAGTVIAAASVVIWFLSQFTFNLQMVKANSADSILAVLGKSIVILFRPLGFAGGEHGWMAIVAMLTGLIAREAVVSTMGVLYAGEVLGTMDGTDLIGEGADSTTRAAFLTTVAAAFTPLAAISYMAFNLLSVPCMAAVAALRAEMKSGKWFFITIGFWLCTAWLVSFLIFQIGTLLGY